MNQMNMPFHVRVQLTLRNGIRYIPLLQNLVSRELKKKYRQSLLGYAWCVLNPLLVMIIMNVVFSHMFRNDIQNYPVYLFAGRMMFSFVTDAAGNVMRSIVSNGALMRKTRIPYYIFPLATFGSSVVNFLFHLIAFAIVLIFTGTAISYHIVAFPLVCLEMFVFSLGFGFILAVAYIYIRDTNYIYAVFTTAWTYLTPLFYPIEALPEWVRTAVSHLNPAFYYVDMSRSIFLYNQWPSGSMLLRGGLVGIVFLVIGLIAYDRAKKQMILYV